MNSETASTAETFHYSSDEHEIARFLLRSAVSSSNRFVVCHKFITLRSLVKTHFNSNLNKSNLLLDSSTRARASR